METSEILLSQDEGVLTVTLNRPEKLNAYTRTMQEELLGALDLADAEMAFGRWCSRGRASVLRGGGSRAGWGDVRLG